jgi:hypothetical protein
VVFRKVTGLTIGDGWTPAETALKLAKLVNDNLPPAARLHQKGLEIGTKWGHWKGVEARYWLERGWQPSMAAFGGFLPADRDSLRKPLPEVERLLMEHTLFDAESVRRITAVVLASTKAARSHADLCIALANSPTLAEKISPGTLTTLPAFSRVADAAMQAMRGLWTQINNDSTTQAPTIDKLARSVDLKFRLKQLQAEGQVWLETPDRSAFPHEHVVTRLAEAIRDASTPVEQLRALVAHHQEHGGGLRWFREQAGALVPLVADTGIPASEYRFRLRSLCRLAAQCGVANMNNALNILEGDRLDEDEEAL